MKNKFLKKLLGFSMSSWITAIIGFLLLMVSTHLYDKATLGKINFFISVITVLASILNLALDQGYLRFYLEHDSHTNHRVMGSNMIFSVLFAGLLYVCCIPWQSEISNWIFGEDFSYSVLLVVLVTLSFVFLRYFSLPWRAEGKVIPYTILALAHSLCMKVAYVFAYPFSSTWKAAFLSYVFVSMFCCGIAWISNRRKIEIPHFHEDAPVYKQTFLFSLPLIPAMLMSNLNNSIPQFFLRSYSGFSSVALYSTAVTLAAAMNIVQSGFNTFWAPYVYENYKTKQKEIQNIHEMIVKVLIFCGICFILLQDVIFLFFKKEYAEATRFLPLLILTPITYTIGETTQIGIALSKKSYLQIAIHLVAVLTNLALGFCLVPTLGVMGAAISAATTSVVTLTIKTYFGNRFYKSCRSSLTMVRGLCFYLISAAVNFLLYDYGMAKYFVILGVFVLYIVTEKLYVLVKKFRSGI